MIRLSYILIFWFSPMPFSTASETLWSPKPTRSTSSPSRTRCCRLLWAKVSGINALVKRRGEERWTNVNEPRVHLNHDGRWRKPATSNHSSTLTVLSNLLRRIVGDFIVEFQIFHIVSPFRIHLTDDSEIGDRLSSDIPIYFQCRDAHFFLSSGRVHFFKVRTRIFLKDSRNACININTKIEKMRYLHLTIHN